MNVAEKICACCIVLIKLTHTYSAAETNENLIYIVASINIYSHSNFQDNERQRI